jgi:hypothetical protein
MTFYSTCGDARHFTSYNINKTFMDMLDDKYVSYKEYIEKNGKNLNELNVQFLTETKSLSNGVKCGCKRKQK